MEKRKWIEGRCSASVKRKAKRLLTVVMAILMVNSVIDYSGFITARAETQYTYDENGFGTDENGKTTYQPAEKLTADRCEALKISKDYANYYAIDNAGQLFWFAGEVNAGNTAICAKLMADIDLSEKSWLPIGTYSDSSPENKNNHIYTGTFDGDHHVIRNLTVNVEGKYETGFFGRTQKAVIKNVGIELASVTNGSSVRAGILGGEIYQSTVTNCYTTGTVTTSNAQAAGIAGESAESTLTNCFTTLAGLTNSGKTVNCYAKSTENEAMFTSGELAYRLNESISEGSLVWGQTLSGSTPNPCPVFLKSDSSNKIYKISFNNGDKVVAVKYVNYNTSINLPYEKDIVLEAGYKLDGWNKGVDTNLLPTGSAATITEDTVYHGKFSKLSGWKSISYYIGNNNLQGLTNKEPITDISPMEYYPGQTTALLTPLNTDFKFLGWYINADLSGDAIQSVSAKQKDNVSLYAKFEIYSCQPLTAKKCQNLGISNDYIGYYAISNASQLTWFSQFVNGKLKNITQNSAANAILLNDITADNDFEPIGIVNAYSGTFDGRNHKVTLNINKPDFDCQALFGKVCSGAVVKNVGTAGNVVGRNLTAGIIGYNCSKGTVTIRNCWNEATITGNVNAAGILSSSYFYGRVNIENCYNTGTINSSGAAGIGGDVGEAAKIKNCYNIGPINGGENGRTFYNTGVGAEITNCYQLDTVGIQLNVNVNVKTLDEFKSGEVCYLLNGGDVTEDKRVWNQNIDNDQTKTYPGFSGGKVYQTSGTFTNKKPACAITSVGGFLAKAYNGATQELSLTYGTDFKWEGTGTAAIEGYYMDNTGTVQTSITGSGAAYPGAAPVKLGSYYAKVSVTGDNNYLPSTAYIPFQIVKEDELNRLINPDGETVTYDSINDYMNGTLIDNGWSGASQASSYHSVKDLSTTIDNQLKYGKAGNPTSVLSIVPHSGKYYMGFATAMDANMGSGSYSCSQDVDISKDATAIDNNTIMFNLSGWLCATGGNTASISVKELNALKEVVDTIPCEKSVTTDKWTQVSLSGAVAPEVRYLQVTIAGTHAKLGMAAFDDLYLKAYSDEEAPPVIASVPEQTMVSGKTHGLNFVVGDPDNEFSTLSISASSSNTSLIPNDKISAKLADGKGSISLLAVAGQTGQATIKITVSDGTKAVVKNFTVIVNPDVQMDTNLIVTGDGLYGWTDPEGQFTKGTSPSGEKVYSHNNSQACSMYQNINVGKFGALIDAGLLNFTASCNVYGNGNMTIIFQNSYGWEISRSDVAKGVLIPSGTRIIRVEIGGTKGCTIGTVSFIINGADLPKITPIDNQSINSGSSTENIPFTVAYAGNSADITAVSSNTAVIPVSGISFGGGEYKRTIKVTPKSNTFGNSTIQIMVNNKEVASFLVTVIPPIKDLTVQHGSSSVTYGYIEAPTLSVVAQKAEGVDESKIIKYQWYYGDGKSIKDATSASYTVPTDLAVGSYSYYCEANCDWYTTKSDLITVTVNKVDTAVTVSAEGGISKENDGTAFELSTVKGTHFTWNGTGTATIDGYYMDSEGNTPTNNENSGATGEGAAPIKVGSYYAKVSVKGDPNYEDLTTYIPFTINAKDSNIAKLYGHSLSLSGNIGINLYMELAPEVITNYPEAYMLFTLPDNSTSQVKIIQATQKVINNKTYYSFTCKVNSKQMHNQVSAQMIFNDSTKGQLYTYSVDEYVKESLASEDVEVSKAKDLMKTMSAYGAYAETYFDKKELSAAAEMQTKVNTVTADSLSSYAAVESGSQAGLKFIGSSLILESETSIRHYFQLEAGHDIAEYAFMLDDITPLAPVKKGDLYYVQIPNITADNLDTMYTVKVGDFSIRYSALSYVYSAVTNNNAAATTQLQNLLKALYLYNKEADNYKK